MEQSQKRLTSLLLSTLFLYVFATSLNAANRSIYWRPYEHGPDAVALFHCDGAAGEAAQSVDDVVGGAEDDGAGGALWPGGMSGGGADEAGALANANPVGKEATLIHGAGKTDNGRFNGGVHLPNSKAIVRFKGGSGQGTTEFWFRMDELSDAPVPILRRGGQKGLRLVAHPDGSLELIIRGKSFGPSKRAVKPEKWHHVSVACQWEFKYNGLARVTLDGTSVIEKGPKWDYKVANYLSGLKMLRIGGFRGDVDEIRISKSVRRFYPYDVDWVKRQKVEEVPDGQPYFRDAQDLLLELGFNQTVRPDGERRDIQVKEESLTVKGLGQSREARGYSGGVQGDALKLGPEMARPEYSSRDLMNDDAGTIAFWFRPLNWDNFSRVDFRRKKGKRRGLNLFKVYGPRPDKLQKYRPMRGGDPSLMSFSIHVTPNANQPVPPRYHPGRWTHVALTWNGKRKTIYIDGKKVGYAGLSAATHVWYRKGGKQRKLNNILPGSHPRRLQISGRGGDLRTLLDDFRIYRRPLAPSEIQNLLALYDPRRELAKLPPMDVSFSYNGVRGSVEASATPLMAEYQNVRSIRVGLYPGQDPDPLGVATAPTSDVGRTDVKLETDPFGFGKYELRISALNGDDAEMAQVDREFTREKPPWWGNQYGISDEVMPGWDPVRVDGSTVKISRREIAFGGTGLPKKIVSAGEPILQSPPRLSIVAGGEQQKWVTGAGPSIITDGEVKANVSGTARSQKLTIHTEATVEFDGFMWFRLRISPRGEQPVEVEKMTLRLPYRPQDAEMIHWWSGDRGFRHPKVVHIGAVPTEEGVVFRSNDEERVRHPEKLVGNFIPYVMLTGDRRGMSWFAENDQGWTKTNSVSAVEVERTDDAVVLRLNIIAEPVQLAGEREIQFGLQPIPLKNRPSYWRRTDDWAVIPDTFSGSNLKGDKGSTAFYLYPKVSWDEVMDIYRGSRMQSRYRNALERYRTRHDREPRPLEIRIPGLYWDMQWIGGFPPHTREWSPQWTSNFSVHTPEFIDFCAWAWHEWIKNTDRTVRGIYMDDCWGAPKSMPDSPATYELPDGRTQVGYELRGYRQRMKRLRQVAHDAGITPHFCGHSTHTFFTPYHSFFDIVLDGEDHYQSPPNQKDFIDYWSLPRIRFMNGEKWGIITSWLGWHGNNLDRDKYPAWTWRHQRAFSAMMALHDITWPLYIKDGAFRIRQEGTQFIPYWERGGPAETENPDVRVSAWRKDGKCLLLAVNTSDKRVEARMKLRFDRMGGTNGKPADVTVKDVDGNLLRYFGEDVTQVEKPKATMGLEDEEDVPEVMLEEQPEDLPVEKRRAQDPDGKYNWENGVLSCPIRPHDYRLFVMEE